MRRITLIIILLFSATAADAAWYQKTDGTIVDPIQTRYGSDLPYSGNNLEPGADLSGAFLNDADLAEAFLTDADLSNADLLGADLAGAILTDADLTSADLTGADLSYAVLHDADLNGAVLHGADLWYADLTNADLSGSDFGNVYYYDDATWTDAFYYTNNEPTWHSGMDAAWRTSEGILALAPTSAVPEPSTLLLVLLGLTLVPRRRRR